jgi:hypothetical protein
LRDLLFVVHARLSVLEGGDNRAMVAEGVPLSRIERCLHAVGAPTATSATVPGPMEVTIASSDERQSVRLEVDVPSMGAIATGEAPAFVESFILKQRENVRRRESFLRRSRGNEERVYDLKAP